MITPGKFTRYQESAMGRFQMVLEAISEPVELVELLNRLARHFESPDHFMFTIDALYGLGAVELDPDSGKLRHVSRD